MKWTDINDIAIELSEAHPDKDPLTINFVDLRDWVLALAGRGRVPLAGSPPSASIWALTVSSASRGTIIPSLKSLSPLLVIFKHLARFSLAWRKSKRSITLPGSRLVSPGLSIFTFRNIRAMMISQRWPSVWERVSRANSIVSSMLG